MLDCPYCKQPAMTHLAKSMLGPARSVACKTCGKRISVHWSSMLAMVPGFGAGLFALALLPSAWAIAPIVLGMVVVTGINAYFIPLVPRDR